MPAASTAWPVTALSDGYYRALLYDGQVIDFGSLTVSPLTGFVVLGPTNYYEGATDPPLVFVTLDAQPAPAGKRQPCIPRTKNYTPPGVVGNSLMIRSDQIMDVEAATPEV
jgi:hypothetical protein